MSKKVYLRVILPYNFIQKKFVSGGHRILVVTYADHALLETTFKYRFKYLKNKDFDVEDK